MSIQVRTADMIIMPSSNESSNGRVYRTTDVMEPVSYNVEFSDEGGIPAPQLEALFDEFAKKRESVEIKFSQKKGRFGQVFVVYDIKPVPKNNVVKP